MQLICFFWLDLEINVWKIKQESICMLLNIRELQNVLRTLS